MTHNIAVSDKTIEVPGGELFVRCWEVNDPTASPLVMLHDSLGCVDIWGDFPEALAALTGRTVVAYDRLGYGRSTGRHDLPSPDFIRAEAEVYFPLVTSSFGISDFCLFGHSVGGGIAITIASINDRCRAVVSESAQAFVEDITVEGVKRVSERFRTPAGMKKLERLHGDKAAWVLSAWADVWLSPAFADWTLANEVEKVKCPLLVIHGDRDDYGSARFPQMIHELSPGPSEMAVIPDCGHIPHREKRDEVLMLTRTFLSKIT